MYINTLVVDAYIKSNFGEIFNNRLNKVIGCGSLTDGVYKVEVHILNFSNNNYDELYIKKGDAVQIKGVMQLNGKNIFIFFTNLKL